MRALGPARHEDPATVSLPVLLAASPGGAAEPVHLTLRQGQVAALIAAGASNADIAEAPGITEKTVDKHVTAIKGRTGPGTRTAIAASSAPGPRPGRPTRSTGRGPCRSAAPVEDVPVRVPRAADVRCPAAQVEAVVALLPAVGDAVRAPLRARGLRGDRLLGRRRSVGRGVRGRGEQAADREGGDHSCRGEAGREAHGSTPRSLTRTSSTLGSRSFAPASRSLHESCSGRGRLIAAIEPVR
ncbi:hypothetical protein E1212_03315 [Jiangella ureilytica]|uniref:HTH luxR-type domain-containing protein n=1 Tax=Jiangella ureilytica TaxID=2530374 RepID=A0A4R4RWZ1_9ACTN|nr:hypothetical protein E1212_03315 [Jiangella ureilytica]